MNMAGQPLFYCKCYGFGVRTISWSSPSRGDPLPSRLFVSTYNFPSSPAVTLRIRPHSSLKIGSTCVTCVPSSDRVILSSCSPRRLAASSDPAHGPSSIKATPDGAHVSSPLWASGPDMCHYYHRLPLPLASHNSHLLQSG